MIRLQRTWPGINRSAWPALNNMAALIEKMANSQTDGSIVWNIDEGTMYVPEPEEFEAVILAGTNPYAWAKLRSDELGVWYAMNDEEGSEIGWHDGYAVATVQAASWVGNVATFVLDQDISVAAGDSLFIKGVQPSGYDGTYTALTGSGDNFTVTLAGDPGAYVTGGAVAKSSSGNDAFREAYERNSVDNVPAGAVVWIKPRYLTDGDGTDQEYKFSYTPPVTSTNLPTGPQWWNEQDQWWTPIPQSLLIQDEGTAMPRRPTLNFIGTPVTCTDVPTSDRTNVTITLSSSTLPASTGSWWQNLLINGGFPYAQRQTPGTLTTITDQTYGPDRWKIERENAGIQYQRLDATAETSISAKWYGRFKKITNAGQFIISQWVLGQNSFPMRGKAGYYVVWLKSNAIRNIKASMLVLGSGGTINTIPSPLISSYGPFSFVANVTAATGSGDGDTLAVSTSWTGFGAAVGTLSTSLLNVGFALWTPDNFAVDDTLDVAMVQMGLGDGVAAVRDWMERHAQQELALCRHFYRKSFNVDTIPAQNTGAASGETTFGAFTAGALQQRCQRIEFDTPMWGAPAVTTYNPAANNAEVRDETAAADCSAVAVNDIEETGFDISATGNAGTAAGNKLGIHWSAVKEL